MPRTFAVTWDYLCPFAYNVHAHVVTALEAGADWEVRFIPFSLKQVHLAAGEPAVWDRHDRADLSGVLALLAGLAVRDHLPDRFPAAHLSLFAARHDDGRDLGDEAVLRGALARVGVDAGQVFDLVNAGAPQAVLREEHAAAVARHGVFGVPTLIDGDDAVFVRLMHRPSGDPDLSRGTIERVLELMTHWPDLNEFKHTRPPR